MVEIDPFDPASVPKKRTALGRFKHEGAETILNKDGRVVCYCGDDERFDHVYRFVSDGVFNPADAAANRNLPGFSSMPPPRSRTVFAVSRDSVGV
jgi:secreted PhoX family phosphatase